MKRLSSLILAVALLIMTLAPDLALSQLRGKALYDRMEGGGRGGGGGLTVTEGITRVTWLPGGIGYLETETDQASGSTIFYKVNPENEKRSELFDSNKRDKIKSALSAQGETSRGDGLPFRSFTYIDDNTIQFSTGESGNGGRGRGGRGRGAAEGGGIGQNIMYRYNLETDKLQKITRPRVERQPGTDDLMRGMGSSQLWTGTFSPDFTTFAFVIDYDIYVKDLQTDDNKRVTFGGNEELMNGRPDWVYPEELNQSTAYWYSPDGKSIAYLQFDENGVFKYPIIHELTFEAELEQERYPKAGETNPTVKLFIVNIETGNQVEVKTNSSENIYIIRPQWRNDGSELLFQRLNRRQNHLEFLAADPATGDVRTILEEREEAFVRLHNHFRLLNDGKQFLWSSERSGWRHLYIYDFEGNMVNQLTEGDWEVSNVTLVDHDNELIYFTGNVKNGLETAFFKVKFDGSGFKQLTTEDGSHNISMDPAGKYYLDTYSSLTSPPVTNLHKSDGKLVRNMATTNTEELDQLQLEQPELVIFKAADGVTELHGILYKPAGFDPNKTYPLLVSTYGGPSGGVRNSWSTTNNYSRTAQLGYIVLKQDNRGTTNRGKEYLTETYLKFGQVDVDDQAAGVKQITQRPYIDGSRVGMYGSSYGGYMTCMSLLRYPDLYHVGVAGSSVTDWRSYDSIYTERYMRTPQENQEGYEIGSVLKYAANLKGKLLLTHGTIDNNVHPGNTIQLIDELHKAGMVFDLMFYPENRHGIRGYSGQHRSKLQMSYFLKHLKPENWEQTLSTIW
ncbi:S9 family peptidase [candidate division KSB1 bacterium]|nr:S9 family peptidase [candidate division KSB1 bacterium]